MKALTFLGPTNYAFTEYQYGETRFATRYFAEALPHFFPEIDEVIVFVTPTVAKHPNLKELQKFMGTMLRPVPIPESHTEQALWEIFQILTEQVHTEDRVVFDITNSFRSIPFLVFIAAAFLRSVRGVKVEAVVYGAFEAKDKETGIAPVFNLTPFISMFDWLAAANQFIYTGNARYLAAQLQKKKDAPLSNLAQNITTIADGLELLRPRDVTRAAEHLPQLLEATKASLPPPFGTVVGRLENAYARFGLPPDADDHAHLRRQLQMINWYLEKRHYVHALSMAREWVVSLLCLEFGLDMWDKDQRAEMEFLLSGGKRTNRQTGEVEISPYREQWKQLPHSKHISRLWQGKERGEHGRELNLANLRNDVLHSGFRKNPKEAQAIIAQTEHIVAEINEIARLWGLEET